MIHPIAASMRPNAEQLPAITARGRDVVVTAGAGTGKTRTLVARYLSLLAEGLPVRSVVAVTFTRKAAHEMRNRVREVVRSYLEDSSLDDAERARWGALYGQLDAARIGTIHTLCAEMLRAHPVEAGRCEASVRIDPGFDVLDEAQAALLQEQAVDTALGWAAGQDDVAPVFALVRERALRDALLTMVESRLAVDDCRPTWAAPRWADWQACLAPALCAFLDDPAVDEAFEALDALRGDGTLQRAADADDPLAGPLRVLLDTWDAIQEARAAGEWERVCACLPLLGANMPLSKGRQANWAPARPKDTLRVLRGVYDATLKSLLEKCAADLSLDRCLFEAMPGLARLHARTVAAYDALKAQHRALDFDDLERCALALLRDDAGVRARWQAEVAALLVDEFQDTNARQRDLLRLLNQPEGKLFVVGDAKQSIYAFRGADVTVFRQKRAEVERRGGRVLSLDVSYRAHQALVDSLNAVLHPVLGVDADPQRPWAEPFAPLSGWRQKAAIGGEGPWIELHLTVGSKAEGALDRAADVAAARIRELVEGCDADATGVAGDRPLSYGDVAILCRASTSFGAYEDALDRAGIPYVTVAGRGFHERPEVRDVLNLLQALADPDDDLALAGALRSPVMGVSDAAIYRLREAQLRGEAPTLWEALTAAESVLADGGLPNEAPRAVAARERLARLRGLVGRTPVADVIKALYDETDYPAALAAVGQARGSRNLAKLLADAHASGLVGVGAFLEYVERLRDVGAREGEARALAEGAVQIMSIHAAKGLEFPVVVVGDCTRDNRSLDGVIIDPDLGPLLPIQDEKRHPLVVRVATARLEDQEAAESARLFYVAATRAQELLILSGCAGINKGGKLSRIGAWLKPIIDAGATTLGEVVWDYDPEGARVHREELRIGGSPAVCCLYEPEWCPAVPGNGAQDPVAARRFERAEETSPSVLTRRMDGRNDGPDPHGSAHGLPHPAMLEPVIAQVATADERMRERERHPPRRVWRVVPTEREREAPPWVVGNIVHAALAQWRFDDPDFDAWAEVQARRYGLTDRWRIDHARRRARLLLERLRGHWLYAEMEAARPRWHEIPYSVAWEDGIDVGVIDVLYRTAQGWTIVDVKTDALRSHAAMDTWISRRDYAAQMARYGRAVEAMLGETPRTLLCFLDVAQRVYLHPGSAVPLSGGS